MSENEEKGKFSAEISTSVIDEALKSVRKHTQGAPDVPVEVEDAADPVGDASSADPKDREISQLKAQLEFSMAKGRELMEKVKDAHEKMLRAVADLENYKKRAQKEKEEVQKFGIERLLKDMLPVMDNLDRALEAAKGSEDFESFKKGLVMTRKLFEDTVAKHGVKAFVSVGKPFDPNLHEAMQQVEREDLPPNQVVNELVRGYTLNDRLVRPALVMVSKAKAAPPADAAPAASMKGDE